MRLRPASLRRGLAAPTLTALMQEARHVVV